MSTRLSFSTLANQRVIVVAYALAFVTDRVTRPRQALVTRVVLVVLALVAFALNA